MGAFQSRVDLACVSKDAWRIGELSGIRCVNDSISSPEVCLTVVTVCRNAGEKIDLTALSIAAQGRGDFEWLVIDGASTDDTVRRAEAWRERLACPVRIVSEPDEGIYDAMNKGLLLAHGRWVHFLNADDVYTNPEVMRCVLALLRFQPEAVVAAYGLVRFVDRRHGFAEEVAAGHRLLDFALSRAPHHQGLFVRTEAARLAGGFAGSFGPAADIALTAALRARGYDAFVAVPGFVVEFALGGVSEAPDLGLKREAARARAVGASLGWWVGTLNFAHGVTLWLRSWLRLGLDRAGLLPGWRRFKARLFPGRFQVEARK
jgi:glycosyltransferase involved in cell wall biosynthesis